MRDERMLLLQLKWATAHPISIGPRRGGLSDRSTAVLESVRTGKTKGPAKFASPKANPQPKAYFGV